MAQGPSIYQNLLEGIDLDEAASLLRGCGYDDVARDIRVLHRRINDLSHMIPLTADQLDFERYLAWDIIRGVRRTLKCPDERAIMQHCGEIMDKIMTLDAAYRIRIEKEE